MHRHGYKGRKFGRERGERRALLKSLMRALVQHQRINTTLIKAKEIRRPMEKLITLAKKNTLASRRLVIARLGSLELGSYLIDVVAPQIKRNSGYLRITRGELRVGDNAEMAEISFVDDIKLPETPKTEPAKKPSKKLPIAKPEEKPTKEDKK